MYTCQHFVRVDSVAHITGVLRALELPSGALYSVRRRQISIDKNGRPAHSIGQGHRLQNIISAGHLVHVHPIRRASSDDAVGVTYPSYRKDPSPWLSKFIPRGQTRIASGCCRIHRTGPTGNSSAQRTTFLRGTKCILFQVQWVTIHKTGYMRRTMVPPSEV